MATPEQQEWELRQQSMEALEANTTSMFLGGAWVLLAGYNLVNLSLVGALPFGMGAFAALCLLTVFMAMRLVWRGIFVSSWKEYQANQIRKKNRPRF